MSQMQTSTREKQREKNDYSEQYNVVMINDDFTTFEFVMKMLRTVFFKSIGEADRLTLKVHQEGRSVIGTYSYDIAVSKVNKAMGMARQEGFPFRLEVEPAG